MKDELDLYADVKWLEIQYEYLESRLKKINKEIALLKDIKFIRESELKERDASKVAEAKKKLDDKGKPSGF